MDRAQLPVPMRREVRLLGDMLGETIRDDIGQDLLNDVEELRRAVIEARLGNHRGDQIVQLVGSWTLDRAEQVARAFTVYFHLVNLAEEHQRIRILRERDTGEQPVRESLGAAAEEVRGRLDDLRVHLVLTAHPTEARRRAVVGALRRISELLQLVDDDRQGAADRAEATRLLREQIDLLWRTSQLRVKAMDPIDEVRTVMTAFDETLFRVIPAVYRELDHALAADSGAEPTQVPAFIRFGSWVGADRDGNPFVTAQVTRETAVIQAEHVLRALEAATVSLGRSLTASDPTGTALRTALDQARAAHPELLAELESRSPQEPFRAYLLYTAQRLAATRTRFADLAYQRPAEFIADLRAVQDGLARAGAVRQAYGDLQHLIWQAETFGFHLAELEVRQHSEVHARALAAPDSAAGQEVLATIRAIAWIQDRFGEQACHRYVVSFTRSADDIAAVHELARLAGGRAPVLDVVPLFESAQDLANAPDVLSGMLAIPAVADRLAVNGRRLEAMLGYSDSAKELGPASATLRLYRAQAELAAWAHEHDIKLTLFHGRGGALGRGGGPAGRAVLAQAPGSVGGSFKVTEQGEVIFARYGQPVIAKRHLEQVSSAVIFASFSSAQAVDHSLAYADTAAVVDDAARASFRRLVDADGFASWFARISPLGEIGGLRIGSRPAKRGLGAAAADLDLADLRAIPWVFAWSQTRLNLPGWYGLGSGLAAVADTAVLRDMYRSWPLFRVLMDNAEMSLAKTDRSIASRYLALAGRDDLTEQVLAEYDLTRRLVLEVTGHDRLLADRPVLSRAVTLRDPYVDALSYLQLRALAALRGDQSQDREQLERLLLLSVNGVAAGLQNTGLCIHIGLSLTTRACASGTRRCSPPARTGSCLTARRSIRAAAVSRRITGCCYGAACRPGSSAPARAMTCI